MNGLMRAKNISALVSIAMNSDLRALAIACHAKISVRPDSDGRWRVVALDPTTEQPVMFLDVEIEEESHA